jgi:GTP-binding protein
MLAGKRDLARVSPTPGFTKLINFFTMSKRWRLVDLPGYGYAHVARKDSARFNEAVTDYLENRPNLYCVFALIDSSLPPQKIDLEFVEWLAMNDVPFVLVFTKTDRIKPVAMRANIEAFTAQISGWCAKLPEIFTCSVTARHGRTELLAFIEKELAMVNHEAPVDPEGASQGVVVPPGDSAGR